MKKIIKIYFSQATVLVPERFPFHFDYWNQPHSVKGYQLHFYELSHLRVEQRFIISMAFVYLFIWEYIIKNSVNIWWLMFFVYWHILPFLEQSLSIICQENKKYDLTYCMPCCTTCNKMYAFQLITYLYHFIRLFFSYTIYKNGLLWVKTGRISITHSWLAFSPLRSYILINLQRLTVCAIFHRATCPCSSSRAESTPHPSRHVQLLFGQVTWSWWKRDANHNWYFILHLTV